MERKPLFICTDLRKILILALLYIWKIHISTWWQNSEFYLVLHCEISLIQYLRIFNFFKVYCKQLRHLQVYWVEKIARLHLMANMAPVFSLTAEVLNLGEHGTCFLFNSRSTKSGLWAFVNRILDAFRKGVFVQKSNWWLFKGGVEVGINGFEPKEKTTLPFTPGRVGREGSL